MNIIPTIRMYLKKKVFAIKYNIKFGSKSLFYGCTFQGDNMLGKNTSLLCCHVGRGTYIQFNSTIHWAYIGKYCSIGDNVRIGLGKHPIHENISTHPAFYENVKSVCGFTFHNDENPLFDSLKYVSPEHKYAVEIGNDVWIGSNCVILDGVKIHDGAVIAAGAVVTKDVEPYSVVAGIPAKAIKYRFSKDEINTLLKFGWWDKPISWIKENYLLFSNPVEFIKNI